MRVMADLLQDLVSSVLHPQPPNAESHPRNWAPYPHRSIRGRGRVGLFGDHFRRAYQSSHFQQDFHSDHRGARQYYSFSGPGHARHPDAPQYHYDHRPRVWQPGPHAEERRAPVSEEQEMRHRAHMDDETEPREPRRSRRSTRFSPPSPENRLALIPLSRRRARSLSRPSHVEGNESSSEATVTNADGPVATMTNSRRQTPAQAGREGTSAPKQKFFANLTLSEGPRDEQDWEADYGNGDAP